MNYPLAIGLVNKVEIKDFVANHKEYNTGTTISLDDGIYVVVKPIFSKIDLFIDDEDGQRKEYYKNRLNNEIYVKLIDFDTYDKNKVDELVETFKNNLKPGFIINFENDYEIRLDNVNHYQQGVSGNYTRRTKKIISRKLMNDIRQGLLATHKVLKLSEV